MGLGLSYARGRTKRATTSEVIIKWGSLCLWCPYPSSSHCSFPVCYMKTGGKTHNSSHLLLTQVEDSNLLLLSATSLKREVRGVDLTVPSSHADEPCGCPYVVAEYIYIFFKSGKHMLPRLQRLQSQEFQTEFSRIKVIYAKWTELIAL